MIDQPRRAVHARGLPGRARIGQEPVVVVETEAVVGAGAGFGRLASPPPAVLAREAEAPATHVRFGAADGRRPHFDERHASASSNNNATGNRARSSLNRTAPSTRSPVRSLRQRPGGSASVVSSHSP